MKLLYPHEANGTMFIETTRNETIAFVELDQAQSFTFHRISLETEFLDSKLRELFFALIDLGSFYCKIILVKTFTEK